MSDTFGGYRVRLAEQVRQAGITNLAVLRAVTETPRHLFVPAALRSRAYEDVALPLGNGQTISQPSTQARYLEALDLQGTERVLEVGTGSGYQTALLAQLTQQVISIERVPELARRARAALQEAAANRVTVLVGDGTLGWRPLAPFDAIVVAAAGPTIPAPLIDQLAEGGRMILPLETGHGQELIRVTRRGSQTFQETLGPARFVPLIGRHGHPADGPARG